MSSQFIIVHKAIELCFKAILLDLESLIKSLARSDSGRPSACPATERADADRRPSSAAYTLRSTSTAEFRQFRTSSGS